MHVEKTQTVRIHVRQTTSRPSYEMVRAGMMAAPGMSAWQVYCLWQRMVSVGSVDPTIVVT